MVHLNHQDFTVRFGVEGVILDLGAIGKGYAIDRATEILRDAGVTSGLLHSGTSTVSAIGNPPDEEAWIIAIENPANSRSSSSSIDFTAPTQAEKESPSPI